MTPDREVINAEGAPGAVAAYSHAVRHGDLLFCSGQIALDPQTGTMTGNTLAEQTEQCMKNLQAVCEGAGTSLEKALRLTIYTTAIDFFNSINDAYAGFFGDHPPARAAIGVSELPRGAAVMIDAIVAI